MDKTFVVYNWAKMVTHLLKKNKPEIQYLTNQSLPEFFNKQSKAYASFFSKVFSFFKQVFLWSSTASMYLLVAYQRMPCLKFT